MASMGTSRVNYHFSNLCGTVYRQGNLVYSPDGNTLYSAVGNRVACFDLVRARSFTFPFEARRNIAHLALSPDGVILLSAALTSHPPAGARPTLPALVGSVSQALAWSDAHPGDTTVVVLATDGLPTACDPAIHEGDATLAIEHLADAAAVGVAGGVLTYVIGIEAPAEGTAREGLDAIAAAGGTERALVVNASFGDELTDTLADVWLDASGCTFDAGLDETEVDHRDARVRLLLANGERPYVSWRAAPADCGDGPGFYVAPNPPHHVVLCPASCDRFGPSFSRTIEVFTSCSMVAGR